VNPHLRKKKFLQTHRVPKCISGGNHSDASAIEEFTPAIAAATQGHEQNNARDSEPKGRFRYVQAISQFCGFAVIPKLETL